MTKKISLAPLILLGFSISAWGGPASLQTASQAAPQGAFCPNGSGWDSANCFIGAPSTTAFIHDQNFYCSAAPGPICPAGTTWDTANCFLRPTPSGYDSFIFDNKWYTSHNRHYFFKPTSGNQGYWWTKRYIGISETNLHDTWRVCTNDSSNRAWQLQWSDDFSPQAAGTRCYNTNEKMKCIYKAFWGDADCSDQPSDWSNPSQWTPAQQRKYGGLKDLNKCHYEVFDSYNNWEFGNEAGQKTNALIPNNIKVEDGYLKIKTSTAPKPRSGYDCGRELSSDPATQGSLFTKNCPYGGALIQTSTNYPWNEGNSANHEDPNQRYVGRVVGYGRTEFRINVKKLGHGAWVQAWLFVDRENMSDTQNNIHGEFDALEMLADFSGSPDQLKKNSQTYGMGWQTSHIYPLAGNVQNKFDRGTGLPMRLEGWHTYAVEVDPTEVRYYVDDCMTHRFVDGQVITEADGTQKIFRIPINQGYQIIIGTPAANNDWMPEWYANRGVNKKSTTNSALLSTTSTRNDNNSLINQSLNVPRSDFKETEFWVDYIRHYVRGSGPVVSTNEKPSIIKLPFTSPESEKVRLNSKARILNRNIASPPVESLNKTTEKK